MEPAQCSMAEFTNKSSIWRWIS